MSYSNPNKDSEQTRLISLYIVIIFLMGISLIFFLFSSDITYEVIYIDDWNEVVKTIKE